MHVKPRQRQGGSSSPHRCDRTGARPAAGGITSTGRWPLTPAARSLEPVASRCQHPGSIDPAARTARAEAGVIWQDVTVPAGQHSLAALAGTSQVLRYLPTNLTTPEIASELYVSPNTVKTHVRSLYAKLGTHRRADTVARARALGLLAPSPLKGHAKPAG